MSKIMEHLHIIGPEFIAKMYKMCEGFIIEQPNPDVTMQIQNTLGVFVDIHVQAVVCEGLVSMIKKGECTWEKLKECIENVVAATCLFIETRMASQPFGVYNKNVKFLMEKRFGKEGAELLRKCVASTV